MENKICRPKGRRYISHVAAIAFVAAAFRRAAFSFRAPRRKIISPAELWIPPWKTESADLKVAAT